MNIQIKELKNSINSEFFERTLDITNYECRSSNYHIDIKKREDYLFNSTINGIEDSDFIFLIQSTMTSLVPVKSFESFFDLKKGILSKRFFE